MLSNRRLWKSVFDHPFWASAQGDTFVSKLASTEGWSTTDTRRVIEEYRRFLYLTARHDIDPVPPEPVDAAWALHLTFTRDYWDVLIPNVIGAPVHRDALAGEDKARAERAYLAFLARYQDEFGSAPPRDIWTHPKRLDWTAWLAILMFGGVLLALGSFGLMHLIGWIFNLERIGGKTDTLLERLTVVLFLIGWTAGFFSPLWAWLLTRRNPRLKATKTVPGRTGSFSIGLGNFALSLPVRRRHD